MSNHVHVKHAKVSSVLNGHKCRAKAKISQPSTENGVPHDDPGKNRFSVSLTIKPGGNSDETRSHIS